MPAIVDAMRRNGPRFARILAAILIPAALAATSVAVVPPMLRQARRDLCRARMARLGHALVRYEAEHRHYPPAAIPDAHGRPLLSWRVAILPQLGLGSLYERFRLDEPWDGLHNRKLLDEMPDVFGCPGLAERRRFVTGYQAIVGPKPELGSIGTLFEWSRGIDVREVIDGTSNTLAIVELKQPIPWTQPGDPSWDQEKPLPEFARGHDGRSFGAFADGAIRFLSAKTLPAELRAMITRDGNEVLSEA
jgi:hypothetical protein